MQTGRVNLNLIRERLEQKFKPFALELSSGRRVPVSRPDFIAVGRRVVVVLGQNDSVTTVDAFHITAMRELPSTHKRK